MTARTNAPLWSAPPLWTATEAAAALGLAAPAQDWRATGVSIDSRSVAPGDMFVALKGERFDGAGFVAGALAAGAAAAVAERRADDLPADAPVLVVPDALAALRALAQAARTRAGIGAGAGGMKAIGVTGSVGKTSTKEALAHMLGRQGLTAATRGNLNNHIGLPLTLARTPAAARYGVYEMGMSAPGEIAPLTALARPDVALITWIAPAHLEAFADLGGDLGGEAAIADEKASIVQGLTPGGTLILPTDSPWFARMAAVGRAAGAEIVGFGVAADAAMRVLTLSEDAAGSTVEASLNGRAVSWRVGAPGRHWALNSAAALAAVAAVGGDLEQAALDLADVVPAAGRGARKQLRAADGRRLTLIDESYNASPAALRAALAVLARSEGAGRKVAVLGDMLELGPRAAELHAALADDPALAGVDLVHGCGPLTRALYDRLPVEKRGVWAVDAAALAAQVPGLLADGDVVMVKGSHGSRMGLAAQAIADMEAA